MRNRTALAPVLGAIAFMMSFPVLSDDIRDSTQLGFEGGDVSPIESYGEIETYPQWANIRNKPVTATRWPSFAEVTGKPAYYPTRWSDIDGVPVEFPPEEHFHSDYFNKNKNNSIYGVTYYRESSALRFRTDKDSHIPIIITNTYDGSYEGVEDKGNGGNVFRFMTYSPNDVASQRGTNRLQFYRSAGDSSNPEPVGNGLNVLRIQAMGKSYFNGVEDEPTWPTVGTIDLRTSSHGDWTSDKKFYGRFRVGLSGPRSADDPTYDHRARLEIDELGRVGIGTSPTVEKSGFLNVRAGGSFDIPGIHITGNVNKIPDIQFNGDGILASDYKMHFTSKNGGSFEFRSGGIHASESDVVARIRGDGHMYASGYSALSDARLKEDVQPLPDSLERLASLRGVSYHWKDRPEDGLQVGLIAQEVAEVFPTLVREDEETGTLSVNYDGLVAPLIESVKELSIANADKQERIDDLQDEVEALEARIAELERMFAEMVGE